jgi:hypothetical protein
MVAVVATVVAAAAEVMVWRRFYGLMKKRQKALV